MSMSQECQDGFMEIINDEGNKFCADCGCSYPEWVSMGFAILICINCAGKHRSFGTHITSVRSLLLDNFTAEQIQFLKCNGNKKYNDYLLKMEIIYIDYENPRIHYYR